MTKRFCLTVAGEVVARGTVVYDEQGQRVGVAMSGRSRVLRAIVGAVADAEERARDMMAIDVEGESVAT